MQLLVPIPWSTRIWALPFLTALAPSERYHQQRSQRHKKLPDWGRQMILHLHRWLPNRAVVVVADSTYAMLELLARCARLSQPVVMITRLRLDAALYDPTPERDAHTVGRPRRKGSGSQRWRNESLTRRRIGNPPWSTGMVERDGTLR